MPFKTTVNWLFNDIWHYLVIDYFDGKIGVFQQVVVRVCYILKLLKCLQKAFLCWCSLFLANHQLVSFMGFFLYCHKYLKYNHNLRNSYQNYSKQFYMHDLSVIRCIYWIISEFKNVTYVTKNQTLKIRLILANINSSW